MQKGGNAGYCDSIEEGMEENRSVEGPVTCRPATDAGSDSKVENRTELLCVCQTIVNGSQRTFSIRKSQ